MIPPRPLVTAPPPPDRRSASRAGVLAVLVAGTVLPAAPSRAERRPVLRVVVDAGHGGSNLGAPGAVAGVVEKRLTMAVSRLLRRRLERDGIEVVFTRETDTYVALAERVRRANTSGGDLFISVHANATPDHHRRGPDVYVSSREVRDTLAFRAGVEGTRSGDVAAAVLSRSRVRFVTAESLRLARAIVARLVEARPDPGATTTEAARRVHQASFDVLEGLQMPATLVEIGFIDHPVEGRELLRPEVMRRIADAVADGIADFSSKHEAAGG